MTISTIISIIILIITLIGFFGSWWKIAKNAGEQKSEIDNRIKSVCDKHQSDMETAELKRQYLSEQLHNHINDNEKDHAQFFKMNEDLNEIKGDLKYLIRKAEGK